VAKLVDAWTAIRTRGEHNTPSMKRRLVLARTKSGLK